VANARWITGELREKDGKLMIPAPTDGASSARRKAARFGQVRIGGVALAVVLTALAGTSHSSASTVAAQGAITVPGAVGSIPAAGTPSGTAGSITYALPPGSVPNWILPMPTAAANSVYNIFNFEWQMWPPMYYTPTGSTPTVDSSLSVANSPVWSNRDKTMTITVKPWKWSNGQPVTSKDVLFTLDLIKAAVKVSPANWASYTPGFFPSTITSMSTPNATTIVVNMTRAVNPTWMKEDILGSISILPSAVWSKDSANGPILNFTNPANAAKIYTFLSTQSESLSTYASNKLWQTVYGPYRLRSFNDVTGGFTMVPNTSYSGPHANPMSNYVGVPFTSNPAEWNAIRSGSVDFGYVPLEDVPQIPTLKSLGYNYFGLPDFGDYFVDYNFKDQTGHFNSVVAQLYFRQAMQHLEDQAGQIKAFFGGDGDPAYGPIPVYPRSPYLPSNAATNPYPFSIKGAISLLKAHGWDVTPNGTDACAKPGTGSGECGAGIPGGTKLAFTLIYNSSTPIPQQAMDLASDAKQAGIKLSLSASNFNYMIQNYNDAISPADENQWAMEDFGGETNAAYPTQFGFLNTGGPGQLGDYSNPRADALINQSISGSNPAAVTKEASFFTAQLPVLWQPVLDYVWAWKSNISATTPTAIENLTQYDDTPQFWYLTN
jgi:peptide/nickel transport system substrate-binding protein